MIPYRPKSMLFLNPPSVLQLIDTLTGIGEGEGGGDSRLPKSEVGVAETGWARGMRGLWMMGGTEI